MKDIIIHQFNPDSDWVTIQITDMFQDTHYMEVKTVDLAAYQVVLAIHRLAVVILLHLVI